MILLQVRTESKYKERHFLDPFWIRSYKKEEYIIFSKSHNSEWPKTEIRFVEKILADRNSISIFVSLTVLHISVEFLNSTEVLPSTSSDIFNTKQRN